MNLQQAKSDLEEYYRRREEIKHLEEEAKKFLWSKAEKFLTNEVVYERSGDYGDWSAYDAEQLRWWEVEMTIYEDHVRVAWNHLYDERNEADVNIPNEFFSFDSEEILKKLTDDWNSLRKEREKQNALIKDQKEKEKRREKFEELKKEFEN